jgi:spermidine/putrescine transport system ATP-binding protein
MPTSRLHTENSEVWVGVRPEKMLISSGVGSGDDGHNAMTGVITDASYIGVSTQYLVDLPWGQEIGVFAQNMTAEGPLKVGDQVTLAWDPRNTFALDAQQDADAGSEKIEGDE